jgi:predicted cation transporter
MIAYRYMWTGIGLILIGCPVSLIAIDGLPGAFVFTVLLILGTVLLLSGIEAAYDQGYQDAKKRHRVDTYAEVIRLPVDRRAS